MQVLAQQGVCLDACTEVPKHIHALPWSGTRESGQSRGTLLWQWRPGDACMDACRPFSLPVQWWHVMIQHGQQRRQHQKPVQQVAVGMQYEQPICCPGRSPMQISANLLENVVCDIVLRLARDHLCSSQVALEC